MSFVNDIISLPLTLQDGCDALDYQTDDVGDLLRYGTIVKWAKYKPVEYYFGGPYGYALTEAQRISVNYGISDIPTWTTKMLGNMLNFWFGVNTGSTNHPDIGLKASYWTYTRPSTAFRLSDLLEDPSNANSLGYFKRAKPPLGNLTTTQVQITPAGDMTFIFAKNEEGVSAGLTLRYEDLQLNNYSVYNMYFGFALWNKSRSNPKFYTLTQNGTMQSFQAMGASVHTHTEDEDIEGNYAVFPFASADRIRGTQYSTDVYEMTTVTNIQSNFIALADYEDMRLTIRWADVKITSLTSYVDQDHQNTIKNIFVITNNMSNYPVDITNMKLEYLKEDGTVDYTQTLTSSVRVNSNSTYSGTADHDFGQTGASHIKKVRMTIVTLQGVVFFHSNDSVCVADVGTGPTPNA